MGCGASSKAALNVIEPPQHRNIKHDAEPVTDSEVLHPSGPEVAADLEQNNHNRHPLLEEFTRNINVRVPEPFIAYAGRQYQAHGNAPLAIIEMLEQLLKEGNEVVDEYGCSSDESEEGSEEQSTASGSDKSGSQTTPQQLPQPAPVETANDLDKGRALEQIQLPDNNRQPGSRFQPLPPLPPLKHSQEGAIPEKFDHATPQVQTVSDHEDAVTDKCEKPASLPQPPPQSEPPVKHFQNQLSGDIITACKSLDLPSIRLALDNPNTDATVSWSEYSHKARNHTKCVTENLLTVTIASYTKNLPPAKLVHVPRILELLVHRGANLEFERETTEYHTVTDKEMHLYDRVHRKTMTPLLFCVHHFSTLEYCSSESIMCECINTLLKLGAHIETEMILFDSLAMFSSTTTMTALVCALQHSQLWLALQFILFGAKLNHCWQRSFVVHQSLTYSVVCSPLHVALYRAPYYLIHFLLACGVDPDFPILRGTVQHPKDLVAQAFPLSAPESRDFYNPIIGWNERIHKILAPDLKKTIHTVLMCFLHSCAPLSTGKHPGTRLILGSLVQHYVRETIHSHWLPDSKLP